MLSLSLLGKIGSCRKTGMNAYCSGLIIFFASTSVLFALSLRLFDRLDQRRLEQKQLHKRED